MSFFNPVSKLINRLNQTIGRLVSWLALILVLIICYDVFMRYLFQSGSVALQELEWHIFSVLFLFGAAYTYQHDEHVRVDIFYNSRFVSERQRLWIDLLGTLFFLLPFCLLIMSSTWPFIINSFNLGEGSPDPGGLPYRFVLKSCIFTGFLLIALQGIANVIHYIHRLKAAS